MKGSTKKTGLGAVRMAAMVGAVLVMGATGAWAYPMYDDDPTGVVGTGCVNCHSEFQAGPGGALHQQHTISFGITECNLCHKGGGGTKPVYTYWSGAGGGYGCAGCHGQDYGEVSLNTFASGPTAGQPKASGYGLRQVHANAGEMSCAGCHAPNPFPPLGEDSLPPYYTLMSGHNLRNSCDSNQEDLTYDMDTVGLDNDGNGVADYPADMNCATTTTTTSTTTTTTLPITCAPAPLVGCVAGEKGKLLISEKAAGKEKMKFQLSKLLPAVMQNQFGDPVGSDTSYALCVYNSANALVGSYEVAQGGEICDFEPCWSTVKTTGYQYVDKLLETDGISKIQLFGGEAGKGKVSMQGKNKAPALFLPTGLASALNGQTSATAQLVSHESTCFGMTFGTVKTADGFVFSAAAP